MISKPNLSLSKNIPYTFKTLAIEFNRNPEEVKLEINQKAANKVEDNITNHKVNDSSQDSIPPKLLEVKRNKSGSKQKKKEREFEMTDEDKDVICFKEGDNIIGKGEDLIMEFLMFN